MDTTGDAGADPEGVVSADLSAAAALDEDLETIETGGIEDAVTVLILVGMVVRNEMVTGLGFCAGRVGFGGSDASPVPGRVAQDAVRGSAEARHAI